MPPLLSPLCTSRPWSPSSLHQHRPIRLVSWCHRSIIAIVFLFILSLKEVMNLPWDLPKGMVEVASLRKAHLKGGETI